MKKLSAFLLGVGLMASSVLAADPVTSVNAVGFVSVQVPPSGGYALVALNFDRMDGSSQISFSELFGTNQLRAAAAPQSADRVLLYDVPSQTYYRYAFKASDLAFHQIAPVNMWGGASTNPVITSGQGFWLQSGGSFTNTNTVVLAGQVVNNQAGAVVNIALGYQILGSQFSSQLDVNTNTFPNAKAASAPQSADQVMLYRNGGYIRYARKLSDGLWHMISPVNNWGGVGETNISVNVGEAFWYKAMTNSIWSSSQPYSL